MSIAEVLVVDDDPAMCRILQHMLSGGQYNIQTSDLLPKLSQPSNKSLLMST